MKVIKQFSILITILLMSLPIQLMAKSNDFSHGIDYDGGSTAVLWFKSNVNTTWVDLHFNTGGAQQNIRMPFNSAEARFEKTINARAGTVVNYSFTYTKNGLAYDSANFSLTVSDQSTNKVSKPAFNPPGGNYPDAQTISMSTSTQNASIYYTLDGSTPTNNALRYTAPIQVSNTTVKAIAIKASMDDSNVVTAAYKIVSGPYEQGVTDNGTQLVVRFDPSETVAWTDLHYSLNQGGQQNVRMSFNSSSNQYEYSINVSPNQSASLSYSFTYLPVTGAHDTGVFSFNRGGNDTVSAPTLTPQGGTYSTAQNVTIATTTSGAKIFYTTDGTAPTSSSFEYAGQVQVAQSMQLKAIAIKAGMGSSAVVSENYVIQSEQVSIPSFSPEGGTYSEPQSVHIKTQTAAATIYYTLDGSVPTEQSAVFVNPITISQNTTLKAMAVKSGLSNSEVTTAQYEFVQSDPDFVQGVALLGSSATVWFKPTSTLSFVILHYSIIHDGSPGAQVDPYMTYNEQLQRWETQLQTLANGDVIHYSFTYPFGAGNKDTDWYDFIVDEDDDNGVSKPIFTPPGGSFETAVDVSLSTTEDNASIHYTTDGTAPNSQSPLYQGMPINIATAATINAITVLNSGQESRVASETYVIENEPGRVSAPTFSHPAGEYDTIIRVNLKTNTPGANIHYTTDGTMPTIESRVFTVPIQVMIADDELPPAGTVQIRAIATKAGWETSAVVESTYTVTNDVQSPWNGMTTFEVKNATNGQYADDQVYWAIVGRDWNTDQFVHVDASGNLTPMKLSDNGQLVKNGIGYANYFHKLSERPSVTIPAINSARLLMSVGSPMYILINQDINGNIGYAGANIENPDDPNIDLYFDFGEFAVVPSGHSYQGIFINTTRVDHFGFPLQLTVTGLDGFNQTVGETLTESREELFARFVAETPEEFDTLALPPFSPYRIIAPAHSDFDEGGSQEDYLDSYISSVWQKYSQEDLILNLDNGWPTFTGRVQGDSFIFTDGTGTFRINGKPTTAMVMLGNGLLDDKSGSSSENEMHKQLQLQAQMCAALNRRVAHLQGEKWHNSAYFFPANERANFYTKFWHDHAVNGLAYGFSYDDVGGYSPSIYTRSPVKVTYTIGW